MITGKTSCGLQYAVKRSGSAVAYCSLTVRCGTRDEEGFHSGIAHFTEHTLFKGTRSKSSAVINRYLDRLGGELNAFTTKEEIVLHATVLKEDLGKAAGLLLELATQATFPEDEVKTEMGVVIDEIKSYKDSPADDIYDRFEELVFEGHPLSGLILGTTGSVRKITSDELRRFVSEKFRPEGMALSIVADLPEERLAKTAERLIDKYFAGSPEKMPLSFSRGGAAPVAHRFDSVCKKRNHQANAVYGGFGPGLYEEKDRFAAVLMCNLLGGPSSNSILNNILREKKGWVYNVEASYTPYTDSGIVAVSLGCDADNLDACMDVIKAEILKLQSAPLSQTRLKAAKKQLLGQLAISSDNGESECLSMGKSLLAFGKISGESQVRQKVESITAEDIVRVARLIFNPEYVSTLVFE